MVGRGKVWMVAHRGGRVGCHRVGHGVAGLAVHGGVQVVGHLGGWVNGLGIS